MIPPTKRAEAKDSPFPASQRPGSWSRCTVRSRFQSWNSLCSHTLGRAGQGPQTQWGWGAETGLPTTSCLCDSKWQSVPALSGPPKARDSNRGTGALCFSGLPHCHRGCSSPAWQCCCSLPATGEGRGMLPCSPPPSQAICWPAQRQPLSWPRVGLLPQRPSLRTSLLPSR